MSNDLPAGLVHGLLKVLGQHHAEAQFPVILAAATTPAGQPGEPAPQQVDMAVALRIHRLLARAGLVSLFPKILVTLAPYLAAGDLDATDEPWLDVLTEREMDVLAGMAQGRTNAAIGAALGIGEESVKTAARNVFEKLGVTDRTHAVSVAWERGFLPDRRRPLRAVA